MTEKTPKVSIIVPVYKAEPYLHRCVDSLLSQTFKDIEVLLVDDGSPDLCGEICDEYAKNDSRVVALHKENGGVSSARQLGLDHARGEYTIHADPDDWIEPDMLDCLYNKAKETDADIVVCDFFREYAHKSEYVSQIISPAITSANMLNGLFMHQVLGVCWNKLIRTSLFEKFQIAFPSDIIRWEDLFVQCSLLLNELRIAYLPRALYHYDQYSNVGSIVRKPTMKGLLSQVYFIEYFEKRGVSEDMLYFSKAETKELAFNSNLFSEKQLEVLYPEIDERYIDKWKSANLFTLRKQLVLNMMGHKKLSRLLHCLSRIRHESRKFLSSIKTLIPIH